MEMKVPSCCTVREEAMCMVASDVTMKLYLRKRSISPLNYFNRIDNFPSEHRFQNLYFSAILEKCIDCLQWSSLTPMFVLIDEFYC